MIERTVLPSQIVGPELTAFRIPSTLNRGVVFMDGSQHSPEGSGSTAEAASPQTKVQQPIKPDALPGAGKIETKAERRARKWHVVEPRTQEEEEALRQEWYKSIPKEERKNLDTLYTIDAAVKMGFRPEITTSNPSSENGAQGKTPQEIQALEVVRNALFSDQERITKVEEMLGRELDDKQKKAFLKAHNFGKNGVYNLDNDEIKERVRILRDEVGLDAKERRKVIESGLAATPVDTNNPTGWDPRLENLLNYVNAEVARINAPAIAAGITPDRPIDLQFLLKQQQGIDDLVAAGVDAVQANEARNRLTPLIVEAINTPEKARQETQSQYSNFRYQGLTERDIETLTENDLDNIKIWIKEQFSELISLAPPGTEARSPLVSNYNSKIAAASTLLAVRASVLTDPNARSEMLNFAQEFERQRSDRFNIINLSSVIAGRDLDTTKQFAAEVGIRGLFGALNYDEGSVGYFYNCIDELAEDIRLSDGAGGQHYYSNEIDNDVVERLINQQLEIARKATELDNNGVLISRRQQIKNENSWIDESGVQQVWTDEQADEFLRSELQRSVRTAYHVWVSSQRQSQVSARGAKLEDNVDAFFSDPGTLFGVLWNLEDKMIDKWAQTNAHGQEVIEYIKKNLVEEYIFDHKDKKDYKSLRKMSKHEREALGSQLFKDFWAPIDLYSSGWRIRKMMEQLDRLMIHKVWKLREAGLLTIPNTTPEVEFSDDEVKARFDRVMWQMSDERKQKLVGGAQGYGQLNIDEVRYALEESRKLGLFMQLKRGEVPGKPSDDAMNDNRRNVWKLISQYRPEEISRLLFERTADHNGNIQYNPFSDNIFRSNGFNIRDYTEFKKELGSSISFLRNQALKGTILTNPLTGATAKGLSRQINFGSAVGSPDGLTHAEFEQLKNLLGEGLDGSGNVVTKENRANAVIEMYRQLTRFTGSDEMLEVLQTDTRFSNVYQRTLRVDDMPLGELEQPDKDSGLMRLHQLYSSEPSGDGLLRAFNDAEHGIKAFQSILKVIGSYESLEKVMEETDVLWKEIKEYNGQDGAAKGVQIMIGSRLQMAALPLLQEVVGLDRIPFVSTTDIQKIYGWWLKPLTKEELREKYRHIKGYFIENIIELTDEEKAGKSKSWIKKEMKKRRKNAYRKADRFEKKAGITDWDILGKKYGMQTIGALILLMMDEIKNIAGKALEDEGL